VPKGAKQQTYVGLLRGINLGARNRVAMADLRALVEDLGGEDVQTYVQSGNVVFGSDLAPANLEQALAERISRALGLDIAVLVRTGAQVASLVAGNPFLASGAEPAALHVTFLASAPDRDLGKRLGERDFAPDELRVARSEVYLHCPKGYGRSKLSNAYIEKQLAVPATTRNWRTVTALAELGKSS
jgi:uncharacterized protein (DUF1697 family)